MGQRTYVLKSSRPTRSRIDYAGALNAEQLAVVEAGSGPLLCIAGAGSGKTRTLTYRVAKLLESGLQPESILLLTFTNKAARQMLDRVAELCGPITDPRRLWGGTFHHAALRLLRPHAPLLGFPRGFALLDREDARELMDGCIAELGLGKGPKRFPKADVLVDLVSAAVNTQTSLPKVLTTRKPQLLPQEAEVVQAAKRYVQRKRELALLDFDDLLLSWKHLLLDQPEARKQLQQRFRAVLVDEYQDTNRLQGDIIDLLVQSHHNLTVVGDDAQSIYSFRGADFTNIIEFPARYPDARVFKLTENYRSRPEILRLANASIAFNRRQFAKELFSRRPTGIRPAIAALRDVFQQAEFVAQRILELHEEGVPLNEIAVLYRAHAHSLEIQLELARRDIPFVVRSGVRFVESAHVKDVLAYLRFVQHPSDELAFKRMIKLVPGIGAASAETLWSRCRTHNSESGPLDALLSSEVDAVVPAKARTGMASLRKLLTALAPEEARKHPGQMVTTVLDGGYREVLEVEHFQSAQSRAQDLEQLAEFASRYTDLESFLGELALLSDFSAEEVREGGEPEEKVVLSSIHQAKGLEWRAVFVVWLVDGRFPLAQALRDPAEEEEERRLFYVACTRARDELSLSYPLVSEPRDRERVLLRPSRFIEELPDGDGAPYDRLQIEVAPTSELPSLPSAAPATERPALPPASPRAAPKTETDSDSASSSASDPDDVPY